MSRFRNRSNYEEDNATFPADRAALDLPAITFANVPKGDQ